jgi:hypothetical protein
MVNFDPDIKHQKYIENPEIEEFDFDLLAEPLFPDDDAFLRLEEEAKAMERSSILREIRASPAPNILD